MYKHTYKAPFASASDGKDHILVLKVSFLEMTEMRHLFLSYFVVASTALKPISSCRASETNGN